MAIADKTRKGLWGRSGNRCAICRLELIEERTLLDDESIVGEECHIVSSSVNGPRHDSAFPFDQRDDSSNLILLCRVHHKMVDDQVETYDVDLLKQIKSKHEAWVKSKLTEASEVPTIRIRPIPGSTPQHLQRVTTAQEALAIVGGAMAYDFDNDDLADVDEIDAVANFLQELQDWSEVAQELEAGAAVKAKARLNVLLREVESVGFWVFGGREVRRIEGGILPPRAWPIAIIRIVHNSSMEIKSCPNT